MKRNQWLNSLFAVPTVAMARRFSNLAPRGVFGLARRRRRSPSLAWFAGGAVAATAAALLIAPSRRKSVVDLLQRAGGGVGKQFGKLVGERVGAHPVGTAKLVQNARDFVSPGGH